MISICIDPEKLWKKYVSGKKLDGHHWNKLADADTGLAMCYQVKGYPHYVLIAPDRRIKVAWTGYNKGLLQQRLKQKLN